MSAELYDAELAGALARPAIDVLPTTPRKGEAVPAPAPAAAVAAPSLPEVPVAFVPTGPDAVDATDATASVAPAAEAAPEEPEVRKVFGVPLSRGRRSKPDPVASDPSAEAALTEVPTLAPEIEVPALEPVVDLDPAWDYPVNEEAAPTHLAEVVPLVPAARDHNDEVRALQALLTASEQVREEAEARTAAAESAARTATNSVQEWQIRHREAEATISELAASLAGAESRMAELRAQVEALQSERDDLTTQLDAATSPTA